MYLTAKAWCLELIVILFKRNTSNKHFLKACIFLKSIQLILHTCCYWHVLFLVWAYRFNRVVVTSFWKLTLGLFLIIKSRSRLRVQRQSLRPTLNSLSGSPALSRKWPGAKRRLGRPNLRWNDFSRSSGRWRMKRMTRRKRFMN